MGSSGLALRLATTAIAALGVACATSPTGGENPTAGCGGSTTTGNGGTGGPAGSAGASNTTGSGASAAGTTGATGSGGSSGDVGGSSGAGGSSGGGGGSGGSSGGAGGAGGASGHSGGAGGGGTTAGAGGRGGAGGGGGGNSGGAGGRGGGTGGTVTGAGGTSGSGGSSGGSAGTDTCSAGATKLGNTCQSGWSAILGKYILNNNWWGTSGATGQQCVWGTCQDGDVAGWVTNWNWSGGTSSVLTYTSIVYGWQYGYQVPNTGLPIQVSTTTAINCGWDFALSGTSGAYNVAYDIWLHPNGNPPSTGGQSDEVMLWLNKTGATPAGSTYASGISIAGTTWTLWEGNVGWPIHTYVRTSNTSSAVMNLMAFMNDLATRGRIPNTRYVTGVQAGVEVRSGGGTLTTNGFYCRIQ